MKHKILSLMRVTFDMLDGGVYRLLSIRRLPKLSDFQSKAAGIHLQADLCADYPIYSLNALLTLLQMFSFSHPEGSL